MQVAVSVDIRHQHLQALNKQKMLDDANLDMIRVHNSCNEAQEDEELESLHCHVERSAVRIVWKNDETGSAKVVCEHDYHLLPR
jgi:hypothetical protein